MLQYPVSSGADYGRSQEGEYAPPHNIDFGYVLIAARRQGLVFGAIVGVAVLLGVIYLAIVVPLYTADAFILIDNRRIRAVESSYDLDTASMELASSLVDSQVEVARAEKISIRVVQSLGLLDQPEFKNMPPAGKGLLAKLRGDFQALLGRHPAEQTARAGETDEQLRLHQLVESLRKNMDVHRVARTMVLQLSYTSPDAEKSARFANAFAEAYLADQLDTKYEATRRASQWLEQRIGELKSKAVDSDLAIQRFRAEHGLISSGGKLVNEQQLSEINTQLVAARGEAAQTEARYRRIDAIVKGRQTTAIVSEAIGNVIVEQLRTKYLEVSKRYSEIVAKLGEEHQAAVSLRAEKDEYEKLMFEELAHIAQGYASELEIVRTREKSLEDSLKKVMDLNANENRSLVALRELEREGETFRNLYQTYLQRYNEALQQQSFPIIEARIITSASPPAKPSHPKNLLTLLLFGVLGGAAGLGVGVYRELQEKGFYSEDQIRRLGLEFLGILPRIAQSGLAGNGAVSSPAEPASGTAGDSSRTGSAFMSIKNTVMSYSVLRPGSGFAETLRATKLAADVRGVENRAKIIGTVSSMPGEGKSVFSKNFASLLALLGHKTLLIDCDLRVARLTAELAPTAKKGLVEAVVYKEPVESLLITEESSGLSFLPCVMPRRMSHTSDLLTSASMKNLLSNLQEKFEYIIIDLPPVVPVIDARAFAPQVHAFVFVVEWRKTGRHIVRSVFTHNIEIYNKCLGVVFNKVNVNELRSYGGLESHLRHYLEYSNSYYFEGGEVKPDPLKKLKRQVKNSGPKGDADQEAYDPRDQRENGVWLAGIGRNLRSVLSALRRRIAV